HCTNFIAPESRAQVAAAFESGQETIGEHLLLRKDGSRFYAEARTRNVWAGSRKLRLMAIRDISERKQSENAVRRMNAELEERVQARTAELSEANRELEAFSYSVSHDLRAPLRHITGFAEMLKDSAAPLNAEATRQLERITGAVKRMTAIVEGLLTLTHSGRTELRQAPLKLGALIDEVREQLAPEMQERQIEWVIEPLPTVHADAGLLREAVSNLIHNALKYTSKRDVAHIHIGSTSEPARPDEVVVFIRDNGAGFDMRFVHKLFGICQRLHTDAEFEGTGIGLANVQRIIQRHGGRVWAEGQLNEGATFYFSLKRAKAK
ncbi:MAG TPA: ATP-binding protein, partial [Burkholderiales bacterium]|nr:ATP-binding protein [Burkholderiales bacterium]